MLDSNKLYRALLCLYPKSHREAYGEQMAQTFEDILSDQQNTPMKAAVWLRVVRELPLNIIEEHIHNAEDMNMSQLLKTSAKRPLVLISVVAVIALGVGIALSLRGQQYSPTTFAQLQRPSHKPACLQPSDNTELKVDAQDDNFIGNTITTSVLDARAGTNVNVYFKTYSSSTATGTAAYGSGYGDYNFTVKKVASNSTNNYVGGWRVTQFAACRG